MRGGGLNSDVTALRAFLFTLKLGLFGSLYSSLRAWYGIEALLLLCSDITVQ